jgi:hypothetical protein
VTLSERALDALEEVLTAKVKSGDRMMLLGGPKEWVVPLTEGLRELASQGLVTLEQGFMNHQAVWTIELVDRAEARALLVAARSESVFFTFPPPGRPTPLAAC